MTAPPLRISRCAGCSAEYWPPREHCSSCLAATEGADLPGRGRVLAFSRRGADFFCVAEFGGVRIMCSLRSDAPPRRGQEVRLLGHEERGGVHAFTVGPA